MTTQDPNTVIAWHFTGDKLRDGRPVPPVGEWLEHYGPPIFPCVCGLHASLHPFDALRYAPGPMLHKVELHGDPLIHHKGDKVVGNRRRIIATIDSTDILIRFLREQALRVADMWDAPRCVRDYLANGGEEALDEADEYFRDFEWDDIDGAMAATNACSAAFYAVFGAARSVSHIAAFSVAYAILNLEELPGRGPELVRKAREELLDLVTAAMDGTTNTQPPNP